MKLRGLIPFLLAAALPAFANAATTRDSGLLITKVNSEQWQIRMIGGTESSSFSGVIESSLPFSAAKGVGLESGDSAKLSVATVLSTTLAVQPGRTDGVDFAAPLDAQLCLRDTGSTGVQVYLGTTLDEAIPVSAPFDLSGNNACGTNQASALATPQAVAPGPNTGRKYHPGHYVPVMKCCDSVTVMQQTMKPGVVGFLKRYQWKDLEPSQGVYNLNAITADVTWATAHGMRLIIMPEDKSFKNEKPGAAYLDKYTFKNRKGGWTIIRWDPFVVTRYKALLKTIGQKFDSSAIVEGVMTGEESAPGVDDSILNSTGYTPEKYRDALISVLKDASLTWPKSRVFWYMNFLPRNQNYIASVANAVAPLGVVMGNPDVMPDDKSLQSQVYPFYTQFRGKMPLLGQVEPSCYSAEHMTSGYSTKYWTTTELFNYARNNLKVNYMFWTRITAPLKPGGYDWFDAEPVVGRYPTFNQ